MKAADDLISTKDTTGTEDGRAGRELTPGMTDGLGERVLALHPSAPGPSQILRIKKELVSQPGFVAALQTRVEEVSRLHHAHFAPVHSVEWVDGGARLALVSGSVNGRRLSEILRVARGTAFALEFIRQLAPALDALQRAGAGFAHGLLTPERIIVTREGRLVVVEHVFGAAMNSLCLPADRLRADFGLALPREEDPIALDARTDVVQLGLIALMLLIGRRLDAENYPAEIAAELDAFAGADAAAAGRLRPWLEGALQLGGESFATAHEANDAFLRVTGTVAVTVGRPAPAAPIVPTPTAPSEATAVASPAPPSETPAEPSSAQADVTRTDGSTDIGVVRANGEAKAAADASGTVLSAGPATPEIPRETPALVVSVLNTPSVPELTESSTPSAPAHGRLLRWPVLVAVVVVVSGLAGAAFLRRGATPRLPAVTGTSAGPTAQPAASSTPSISPASNAAVPLSAGAVTAGHSPDADVARTADTPRASSDAPVAVRHGKVSINSPIDLQILEGDAVVGASGTQFTVGEGPHTFTLVNDALGYRSEQTVTVKANQTARLSVTPPNGTISINATPWADVTIDGAAVGETPLANLSVSIGTHEVVFHHPTLGEQRRTVVVKTNETARVSAQLQ